MLLPGLLVRLCIDWRFLRPLQAFLLTVYMHKTVNHWPEGISKKGFCFSSKQKIEQRNNNGGAN